MTVSGAQKGKKKLPLAYVIASFGMGVLSGLVAVWAEIYYGIMIGFPLAFTIPEFWYYLIAACIIAPFVEELAKPIGLYLIKIEEKPRLSPFQWILLGLCAGLGFKLIEDVLYALAASDMALFVIGVRSLFPVHLIGTSIAGFGIALWDASDDLSHFFYAILISMLIHGFYNFLALTVMV